MNTKTLRYKIINGEVDPNNMELFFGDTIKAAILFLNNNIKLRGKQIPHFIINTGDEIMYRELMNYEYSKTEVTDEDFIYNQIPRCIITPSDITTLPDQLTQPYSRGYFEMEYEDSLYEFTAETRRMPINININLKYYIDSYTDTLNLSQYLITNLSYIRIFKFVYMGEEVMCSMRFPDGYGDERPSTLDFDTESRYKTISLDLTIETNIPIFDTKTVIESDAIVSYVDNNIGKSSIPTPQTDEFVKRKYQIGEQKPIENTEIEENKKDAFC